MSWIPAIASATGSLGSSFASAWAAREINEDNLAFQREFAQNGVRWKVADMREAGLNPLLASGINATTPAGGSSVQPDFSGIGASAREIGRMLAERTVENADEQIATAKTVQDVNSAQAEKIRAEAEKVRRETTQIPTLTQEEIASIEHRKHSTYFGALVNDIGGLISRLGTSEMSRVEKQAEALLRRRIDTSGLPAFQRPSDYEISQMAKKIAEQKAKKTTDKGGVKHPTGRSVLY